MISPQILNEGYRILAHKRQFVPVDEARRYLQTFVPACTAPLDTETHRLAYDIEDRYRLSWWDCLAVASALQASCRVFHSEDLAHGQSIQGMIIVNPFRPGRHAPHA